MSTFCVVYMITISPEISSRNKKTNIKDRSPDRSSDGICLCAAVFSSVVNYFFRNFSSAEESAVSVTYRSARM